MEIQVLGCNGPFSCAGEATSGYLLQADDSFYLMDCGAGVLGRLTALTDPAALKAVFLTHLHYDHMSDMGVLHYCLSSAGVRLPVYVPGEDKSEVSRLLSSLPALSVRPYEDEQQVGSLLVRTCLTKHPVPNRALRIEYAGRKFVYTGDAAEKGELAVFAHRADLLLADAAFARAYRPENAPHMSASDAAELAAKAQVGRLVLTHFSPQARPEKLCEEARAVFPATDAAVPDMRITV